MLTSRPWMAIRIAVMALKMQRCQNEYQQHHTEKPFESFAKVHGTFLVNRRSWILRQLIFARVRAFHCSSSKSREGAITVEGIPPVRLLTKDHFQQRSNRCAMRARRVR